MSWEENRADYYTDIAALQETAKTKIDLRNFADWVCDVALLAERARALNQRFSNTVYRGIGSMADLDYSGVFDGIETWEQAAVATRDSLMTEVTSHMGATLVLNFFETLRQRYQLLKGNWTWFKQLMDQVAPAEE